MNIAFRVDASGRIGSGHVMRCLTLADQLAAAGAEITFLCRVHQGHLGEVVTERGHALRLLPVGGNAARPPQHAHWLAATLEEDIAQCLRWLPPELDLLVVDHYALDWRWEKALRPRTRWLMVIDDLADRHHDCDILLDQNLAPHYQTRYAGRVPPHCRLLLGPQWALLRPEFYRLAQKVHERQTVQHLLIFLGGSDSYNLTGRILSELAESGLTGDVVIGRANPHQQMLADLCRRYSKFWKLHVQTGMMAELVARADLALGGGGTSHWERCLLGLPALVITLAENQVETTRLLHERGACCWLGNAETVPAKAWRLAVEAFVENPEKLSAMSRSARTVVPPASGVKKLTVTLKALIERGEKRICL